MEEKLHLTCYSSYKLHNNYSSHTKTVNQKLQITLTKMVRSILSCGLQRDNDWNLQEDVTIDTVPNFKKKHEVNVD
ncbi:hypothetical protein RYX36_001232, partial [Vicia faba]